MSLDFFILTLAALLTSILSGTIGMGGGMLLLAIMAQYFPPTVLIPLHAIIQLASNTSRVMYSYQSFHRQIVTHFALGAVIGAIIGSQIVMEIPESLYKILLGAFIIILTFIHPPKMIQLKSQLKWISVGSVSSFLGLLFGATGPLIAPFYLSENLKKDALVATKAGCQVFTHLLKIIIFFILGFTIGPHVSLLVVMIVMVIIGTYMGKLFLHRMPEQWFIWIFKIAIVLLATRMIFQGILI